MNLTKFDWQIINEALDGLILMEQDECKDSCEHFVRLEHDLLKNGYGIDFEYLHNLIGKILDKGFTHEEAEEFFKGKIRTEPYLVDEE